MHSNAGKYAENPHGEASTSGLHLLKQKCQLSPLCVRSFVSNSTKIPEKMKKQVDSFLLCGGLKHYWFNYLEQDTGFFLVFCFFAASDIGLPKCRWHENSFAPLFLSKKYSFGFPPYPK